MTRLIPFPPTLADADELAAWIAWAELRGTVRLTDGRVGRLVYFPPHGGKAKVLVTGRHERVPVDHIEAAVALT
jgi:hypothetical protein